MKEQRVESHTKSKVYWGTRGEDIAAEFLEKTGFKILHRNYRIGHSDIDILALDGSTLVFIEVRTKLKIDRGMPEETLTSQKLRRMRKTAETYIAINSVDSLTRLDALCIVLDSEGKTRHLEHYKGVGFL